MKSRRHRPASKIELGSAELLPLPDGAAASLTDDVRADLWAIIHASLFAANEASDPWTNGVTGRPAVRRVWSSPPIGGILERIPEDVAALLEEWFSLVEPSDVYAFVESAHDSLEGPAKHHFTASVNAVLERLDRAPPSSS